MTNCRKCGRKSEMFLCSGCVEELEISLDGLPWLLRQLEVTTMGHDRLSTGEVGKGSSHRSPLNTDAMKLADKARNTISTWVRDLCETRGIEFTPPQVVSRRFVGPLKVDWRRVPDDYQANAADGARWLGAHVNAIALDIDARRCFDELHNLVDEIVAAINRPDRHFAGRCPTVIAYSRTGEAIECGKCLYAGTDAHNVTCPKCEQEIDVQRNRLRAWRDGDTMTERVLLDKLTKIDEPVSRVQFYAWIKDGLIEPVGWMHKGNFVERFVQRGDPRVFSFRAVRRVREAEQNSTRADDKDRASRVNCVE